MAYSGNYRPRNPQKYIGDPSNIIYRSSWEARVMSYLDQNPKVLAWKSEEIVIPYFDPVTSRYRRYYPDFWVRIESKSGIREMIWEVKPMTQTKEPKFKSKVTKRYIQEVCTYGTNQAKWVAAEGYCKDRGWEFMVLTEENIFGKKSPK